MYYYIPTDEGTSSSLNQSLEYFHIQCTSWCLIFEGKRRQCCETYKKRKGVEGREV